MAAFIFFVLYSGALQLTLAEKFLSSSLSSSEVDELCELISNEFLMNGIQENFEPNSYGLELELLLDTVNRSRGKAR
ncbi:hypothetical protein CU666_21765 [Pseudomonas syringae pv. actinidifoliorum]|nr:hypothetical protein [Pseudomonas syringae]NAT16397.1 hypothetical protein [Pseudomonas syringae pv. actinidifoliorum]MBL3829142.1 hypothetical protein [Pseudomonas syringae pv. theae]MBL3833205.1 hypothetical protein [Pseudomonas syringae pv. theae]MBL3868277.1 hypothetical protein [Pseudomonas syringae pv. theae]NAT60482.1 hypothetical protein [Pseudomonas syringae pv. actinidifoliorum]